ncbi:hypothetical protein CONPUDRAFT_160686 [Coniophora puteana RWD-64-598 SS2]|uniref:Uncharacterized protein n=1 Tax=Coniophora puteana (strain RWD-64-598) TaxID=741705 RepID=R7SCD4_CONPW|nr:uncharacterized protein CONPUDRAFT_160686 [Coniophora puteana RWD-64-598 SS2]EIW73813.1 hypothetical protein CONPUDRAFT_160686 [Coniophora puteana RWD-64-598 SS2]
MNVCNRRKAETPRFAGSVKARQRVGNVNASRRLLKSPAPESAEAPELEREEGCEVVRSALEHVAEWVGFLAHDAICLVSSDRKRQRCGKQGQDAPTSTNAYGARGVRVAVPEIPG